MLFECLPATELWKCLGMFNRIFIELQMERSGSVVLEKLLIQDDNMLSIMPSVGFKEVLITGCWYLWWARRQVTHNGTIKFGKMKKKGANYQPWVHFAGQKLK